MGKILQLDKEIFTANRMNDNLQTNEEKYIF